MNAVIRLDDKGSPYLIVNYDDREGDEQTASDDAERLFFTRLNQNGGILHLVPGKGKQVRMLVTTGSLKRKANVTESTILGEPEPRSEPIHVMGRVSPHEHFIKEDFEKRETPQAGNDASLGSDPDEGGDAFPR
jgi:hypothetical protein